MREKKETTIEKEWEHAGLKCKVAFTRQSHRCGYVAVPKGHIAYNKTYDDLPVDVHGGLTFGDVDNRNKELEWFGFDCAHFNDISAEDLIKKREGHFWTLEETIAETNRLAEQLQKITLTDLIKHKLEYMPDWLKDNVQIVANERKDNP
jgi:hypothetical protein